MLKKTYTSLLIMALVLALLGTAAAEPFVNPPEDSYRVINPPEPPYKDIWQSDAPYPRNIKWDFNQNPVTAEDAVYAGSDDPTLMTSDTVTLEPVVEWFPISDKASSDSIGIDNSSGTDVAEGKAVFNIADHMRDWPFVKHVWAEIKVTIVSTEPQLSGGARVVSNILFPENCGLVDAGSHFNGTPEDYRLNYWFWIGPSPAWEEIELLIRAEAGEQVFVDSVHIATESVIDPMLCEAGMCVFYFDADGDGYGDPNNSETGYTMPSGYVIDTGDCDDTDPDINPGAAEICNDVDDNCDGQVDEGPDSDEDGITDCFDLCPNDSNKSEPGICGCGVADMDADGDGTADCNDGCPDDANKISPGACGCGVADSDSDGDGTPNCIDGCPSDPNKTEAGQCGCGVADTDSDGDDTADCNDACPNDPDNDADADGVCGDLDNCPDAPNADQADADGDGICGDIDNCPEDSNPYQYDVDGIGGGDLCDMCPAVSPDQCNPNGSGAAEIGVGEAGTLVTPDENVEIVIDQGDLAENATISVTQPILEDPQVDVLTDTGRELGKTLAIYILEPKEPGFAIPAEITVRTDVTPLSPVRREQVGLYRLDEAQNAFVPVAGALCSLVEYPPEMFVKECKAQVDQLFTYAMVELIRGRIVKADVVTELESARTGDRRVDRVINKVVKFIKRSLRKSYWQDELHLKDKHGSKVFTYEGLAVLPMRFYTTHWSRRGLTPEKAKAIEAFSAVIPRLVDVDRMLAQTAIDETREMSPRKRRTFERYLAKAEKAFQKGLRYVEKDRPWFAIYMFKRSWSYAMMARKVAK